MAGLAPVGGSGERFEQVGDEIGGYAVAVVLHRHDRLAAEDTRREANRRSAVSVRVRQEVHQHAVEAIGVADDGDARLAARASP